MTERGHCTVTRGWSATERARRFLPLTAPRWVGGSGARAEGPFAPGGQSIALLVVRVEASHHHDRFSASVIPENGHPDRRPSHPDAARLQTRQRTTREPARIAGLAHNDTIRPPG